MDPEPAQHHYHSSTSSDPLTSEFHSLNGLAPDVASLVELATRGSWRAVLDKVSQARSLNLLAKPHEQLVYLTFSALALVKLRRFTEAATEIDTLDDFDSPQYRYESYPDSYGNRSGSMVSFPLRWIHAIIPIKLGHRQDGMDRLYTLLCFVREKIAEKEVGKFDASVKIWKNREACLMNYLIGQHLNNKEFAVSLRLVRDLLKREDQDPVLVSRLGYIQMQIGDLEGAKKSFNKVEMMVKEGKHNGTLSEVEFENLVSRNKALVYLVGKDYVSAVREYEKCIERDNADFLALNNKALCLMYSRDLSDSIKVLENALERLPTVALHETVVVNLCSMYELAYVNHSDTKRKLNNWITQVAPDDFDTSCTRI